MSEGALVPISKVPKGRKTWLERFMEMPEGTARPYTGTKAQVAWTMFHRLKKAGKLGDEYTTRSEGLRGKDAVVWVMRGAA